LRAVETGGAVGSLGGGGAGILASACKGIRKSPEKSGDLRRRGPGTLASACQKSEPVGKAGFGATRPNGRRLREEDSVG